MLLEIPNAILYDNHFGIDVSFLLSAGEYLKDFGDSYFIYYFEYFDNNWISVHGFASLLCAQLYILCEFGHLVDSAVSYYVLYAFEQWERTLVTIS